MFYTLSLIGKDREKRRRESEAAKTAEYAATKAATYVAAYVHGYIVGRAEGVAEERKRWQQWNEARIQAAADGREFNEPPPGS